MSAHLVQQKQQARIQEEDANSREKDARKVDIVQHEKSSTFRLYHP